VTLSLVLALVDAVVGAYLLWYARKRQRGPKEPVAIVGLVLLIVAGYLGAVAWKAAHPTVHRVSVHAGIGT
jgi:hypothetical protein